ncbi:MAG: biotin/lipoyl-binding protein, partial [Cellulomonas sp.]|nr:biotin/lipoyl-binding protein [Cellulomonas sp.]
MDRLSGGRSNLTYRVQGCGAVLVLRHPPTGGVLQSAHDMAREWTFITAMSTTKVPVAGPVATVKGGLGDTVTAGEVLASLDPTSLQNALDQESTTLQQAQQQLSDDLQSQTASTTSSASTTSASSTSSTSSATSS